MFYVYILEFHSDRSWYIGYSDNLKQRLQRHRNGEVISTKLRGAFHVMYYEGYRNKKDALGREQFLKSGNGRQLIKKQLRHYLADT